MCGTKLLQERGACVLFGIHTGLAREPLSAEEARVGQRLAHHLAFAMRLDRRRASLQAPQVLGISVLDRMSTPLALLDGGLRLRHANTAAKALLAREDAVHDGNGLLRCRHTPRTT